MIMYGNEIGNKILQKGLDKIGPVLQKIYKINIPYLFSIHSCTADTNKIVKFVKLFSMSQEYGRTGYQLMRLSGLGDRKTTENLGKSSGGYNLTR